MNETMDMVILRRLLVSSAIAATAAFVNGPRVMTIVAAQGACEGLASLALPHTSITSAAVVPEGPVGTGRAGGPPPIVVPARCVVKGVTKPSSDSPITFEVWMPVAGWNSKYQQMGNGGWAGSIPTASMVAAIMRGYATAGTDDGHAGGAWADWAIGHPEKLVDFGYRAVHETSVQAKAIVAAFYKRDASKSYFFGCSDGGREALMEAQRFPDDFHGIIAGAPANNWTGLMTMALTIERALDEANLPASKLPAIQAAALNACDSLDSVKDGLIEDPRVCKFDPVVLTCKGTETDQCLTPPQVITLRKIYEGPRHPRTGVQIAPGFVPGTEAVPGGWVPWIVPPPPGPQTQTTTSVIAGFGNSFYGQAVAEDPKWDFRKWNFESDYAFAVEKTAAILNSMSPDLRSFRAAGGKLLQYHGWGDAAIPASASIEYYDRVRTFMAKYPDGRSTSPAPLDQFYRLFMVPGMGHCSGGIGPNTFGNGGRSAASPTADPDRDILAALERWVERNVAPDRIIASGTQGGDAAKPMTRPLCPYPQIARYNGTGDPYVAESFTCAVPRAGR
jgi:tannase/feruloyl esterase